eukprot:4673785-Pyramimonas_sp.AAC.1
MLPSFARQPGSPCLHSALRCQALSLSALHGQGESFRASWERVLGTGLCQDALHAVFGVGQRAEEPSVSAILVAQQAEEVRLVAAGWDPAVWSAGPPAFPWAGGPRVGDGVFSKGAAADPHSFPGARRGAS